MTTRATGRARLHFGFRNLSLERDRLFGSLGVALERPRVVVEAEPAVGVQCSGANSVPDEAVASAAAYARRAVSLLDVGGARITVDQALPRHVGLGSGTQLALSTLSAVARAYDRTPNIREHAGCLGRGRRSGIGIAAFESGGFVIDGGVPTDAYTEDGPDDGNPSVPSVTLRREIPDDWRFLLVLPDVSPGKNGDDEEESMRAVLRRADPAADDRVGAIVERRMVPALEAEDIETFGAAVTAVDRLNGRWYTDEQGDVYRPPVGEIIGELTESGAVFGAGQSSWGPAVYGITTAENAAAARNAGLRALSRADTDGDVMVVPARNRGGITTRNNLIKKN
ncbi:beta-ribofuranosylaminobenzene 5'-phosphate synthase family protein [Halobellus sp. GM3]|uniref:beta-ribofuranosylaminobenzene 5'-phosphate synthase family protein n=1 Tax=Halobellus sp. GM3 TaxID=3458410 RepID=UPI00403D8486